MKQLFIFDETSQATIYGIGTYIRECVACLCDKFQINIVILYSDKDVFTIVEKGYYRELHIPEHQIGYTEGKSDERFYINSMYLLHDFVNPGTEQIFHFNHVRYSSSFDILREYYPNCKIVLTIHYLYWCFIIGGNTTYFKEIIRKSDNALTDSIEKDVNSIFKNEMLYFNKVDHIICLSKCTKELLISEYHILESKISLIYNGLKDEGTFLSVKDRINLKGRLRFSTTDAIILFVGRLGKFKGLDYIIQALKKLLKTKNEFHLVIIGDGDFDSYLRECRNYHPNIHFTGRLEKKELYEYYQIANIGVMLSKHEQCSYVAIEMMMFGLPIIVSDSPGLKEMVIDGINGYKIRPTEEKENISFDIDTLCELLLKSLIYKDEQNLHCSSRSQYEKQYSLMQMQKKLLNVYNKISNRINNDR